MEFCAKPNRSESSGDGSAVTIRSWLAGPSGELLDSEVPLMQTCKDCGEILPLIDFLTLNDLLSPSCRDCRMKWSKRMHEYVVCSKCNTRVRRQNFKTEDARCQFCSAFGPFGGRRQTVSV